MSANAYEALLPQHLARIRVAACFSTTQLLLLEICFASPATSPPNYRAGAALVRVYGQTPVSPVSQVAVFVQFALRSNISLQKQEFEHVHGNDRAKKQFHARNFLETCHCANAVVQKVSELEVYQMVVHNNSIP